MTLTYRSFCSGIGAPECAWTPLGWRCLSSCEVDPQASAVLAHHYPDTPNLGDMTAPACKDAITHERADLFVAGTPCQSFSVAGLRKGMADPRGNLALVFLGLVDAARPRWVVWENVPGVLSSSGGRDFGSFLGGMAELGYGFAYRVLDAQYIRVESHARAVPQRRRRVFVVGHLGDWRRAAAVLLEREGLCGHPAPRREAGQDVAGTFTQGAHPGGYNGQDAYSGHLVAASLSAGAPIGSNQAGRRREDDVNLVAHALKASGSDGSEDGTGRGVPIVVPILEAGKRCGTRCNSRDGLGVGLPTDPMFSLQAGAQHGVAVAFQTRIARNGRGQPKDVTDALTSCDGGTHADSKPHVAYYAFAQNQRNEVRTVDIPGALASEPGMKQQTYLAVESHVRRLTPNECERLQGFPDHYTQVPFKGKPMADAPRYRMLGNSMAVNVMSWIGQRVEQVESAVPT